MFHRNHESLMIVKGQDNVVGGITMRIFKEFKFAEIVFCAITSVEQVKGYGSFLMNYLKEYVKSAAGITHFLTYADNYAVGYFKKQASYIIYETNIFKLTSNNTDCFSFLGIFQKNTLGPCYLGWPDQRLRWWHFDGSMYIFYNSLLFRFLIVLC